MLDHIYPENLLFLDIETIPAAPSYEEMEDTLKTLWDKKASQLAREGEDSAGLYPRSAIYAEFGKIICISVGLIYQSQEGLRARLKSFAGEDEVQILNEFAGMLKSSEKKRSFSLCAHNGKEFDFPYIARRMLINGIELPPVLDIAGKKPWEIELVDTMELWKFGDYKSYVSLELLTAILDIPSPKDDIDGSMVADIWYREKDLPRIIGYCEKDVLAIIQLMLKFKGMKPISGEMVESLS